MPLAAWKASAACQRHNLQHTLRLPSSPPTPNPRVLPTGSDDGLVEFVPSVPLSRLLAEHRSIHRFLLASGQGDASGAQP